MAFCPICKNEYRPGFTMCAECKVPLVERLEEAEKEAIDDASLESAEAEKETMKRTDLSDEEKEFLKEQFDEEMEALNEQRKKLMNHRTYEDKHAKAADYRSSAIVLTVIGILGILVLALLYLGYLPAYSFLKSNYLFLIVMGLMFLVFIAGGMLSFRSVGRLMEQAAEDDKTMDTIRSFMDEAFQGDRVDEKAGLTDEDTEEQKYFKRWDYMSDAIKEMFPDTPEALVDSLLDERYNMMYENNDH